MSTLEWLDRDRARNERRPLGPTEAAEQAWKRMHPVEMTTEEWLRYERLRAAGVE